MYRTHDEAARRLLVLATLLTLGCRSSDSPTDPTTGSVAVSVSTAGSTYSLDPDGYSVRVDGGPGRSVGANASTTLLDLAPGPHVVLLDGVAPNCTVADNPRTVEVVAGDGTNGRVAVAFSVSCASKDGSVQISALTSGSAIDRDGYGVSLRNLGAGRWAFGSVATNGTLTLADVQAGRYAVSLSGVAANCDPAEANPREITVVVGVPTPLAITVSCGEPEQIALVVYVGSMAEIFVASSDGSGDRQLTFNDVEELDPAWSPDGTKIAFASRRDGNLEIYVMNANGTNPVRLTNAPSAEYGPTWSPDGTRIAFVSDRDGNAEVYAMNADGTSPVRLTTNSGSDDDPAWSPDGSTIAFRRDVGSGGALFLMDANGASPRQLMPNRSGDRQPSWSPDGTKIAFAHQINEGARDIRVVNADGSGVLSVTVGYQDAASPTWSPNGRKIAFTRTWYYEGPIGGEINDRVIIDVFVVGVDGVSYAAVTRRESVLSAAWGP